MKNILIIFVTSLIFFGAIGCKKDQSTLCTDPNPDLPDFFQHYYCDCEGNKTFQSKFLREQEARPRRRERCLVSNLSEEDECVRKGQQQLSTTKKVLLLQNSILQPQDEE